MKLPCCIFAGFECVSVQVRVRGARSDQVPCTRSVCVCVRAAAREGTGTGTVAWRGSGHGGGGGAEEPSPGEHARPYQPVDASAGFKSLLHSPCTVLVVIAQEPFFDAAKQTPFLIPAQKHPAITTTTTMAPP